MLTLTINVVYLTNQTKITSLALHGRTMIMMYRVTKDIKYLKRARKDLAEAKTLQRGYQRPVSVL